MDHYKKKRDKPNFEELLQIKFDAFNNWEKNCLLLNIILVKTY